MYSIKNCSLVSLQKILDPRGDIGVVETGINCPFEIARVYYIHNVPKKIMRGGHAHYQLQQLIIPVSGSFDIELYDGSESISYTLNDPGQGLYICPEIWRNLDKFSEEAVALVLASHHYEEDDYIRDYNQYQKFKEKI